MVARLSEISSPIVKARSLELIRKNLFFTKETERFPRYLANNLLTILRAFNGSMPKLPGPATHNAYHRVYEVAARGLLLVKNDE